MHLLANENVPRDAVTALRAAGHDVVWVREAAPGSSDPDILAWAVRDARVVLTFDKDFGELAFRAKLPATCGIILLRLPPPRTEEDSARIAAQVSARTDWVGQFSVMESDRVRMRDLPSRS